MLSAAQEGYCILHALVPNIGGFRPIHFLLKIELRICDAFISLILFTEIDEFHSVQKVTVPMLDDTLMSECSTSDRYAESF